MMIHSPRRYLPAAGYDWALPLYDPLVTVFGGNPTREILIDQAQIQPGLRVLEIGCGTGSLVLLIKRLHPAVDVVGLDPDANALGRGQRKAQRARLSIEFSQGFADALPYPNASFDRVFSAFMFHHLPAGEKEPALREARRVLKAEGSLHFVDFARPESRSTSILAHVIHSPEQLADNSPDRLIALLRRAGFSRAEKVAAGTMFFGAMPIDYYVAG